jgi:hypothetical protein
VNGHQEKREALPKCLEKLAEEPLAELCAGNGADRFNGVAARRSTRSVIFDMLGPQTASTDYSTRTEVLMSGIPTWRIAGDWFDNCSCAVACPCTFAQPPDNGFCDSVLFWHIQRGHYGEVNLDGLSFVRVGRWEGDLWAGKVKGAAGLFIDERADERQAEALPLIFGGRAGGFLAQVAALFTEGRQVDGVERARITFEIAPDRAHWGVEIAGKVKAWAKALTGPTSLPGKYPQLMNAPGCETGPGTQLVTWGKSTICSVDAFGYKFQWTTNSSKHIPFDWNGP